MRRSKISVALALVLTVFLLAGSLPLSAFAVDYATTENGTPNYSAYRGSGMHADGKGVMIYNDLSKYHKESARNVALSTDYKVVGPNATNSSGVSTPASYEECPVLYVDYAVYYDDTIEGNTIKIRYGLSMEDSVAYVDKNGTITVSEKSPIELSASYKNDAYPDYNAGYGMVYDEEGNLEYTTRHYDEKAILFYVLNHSASERIGQEDDVSILSDYIAQGYVIITLDFKSHENAVTPYITQALVSAHAMFRNSPFDVPTSPSYLYFLPEGCRIERDVWYWDSSIWGVEGTLDAYRNKWNQKISCKSTYVTPSGTVPTFPDTYQVGNLKTVDEMVSKVGQSVLKSGYPDEFNGMPIEYKLSMNIIYPSQPRSDYEVPVYIEEGTNYTREDSLNTSYKCGTFSSFALNGYACVEYDHCYWPFLYRSGYQFYDSGSDYALATNAPKNAQAAVRCVRSLADVLDYSRELLGAAGISKATFGLGALSLKNNKNYPHGNVSFTDFLTGEKKTYNAGVFEADIRNEDGTVKNTIVQPFMYYDESCTEEISSDTCVTYISSGEGYERLFGTGSLASYEKVPLLISGGLRDEYNCYNYWDTSVAWFEDNLTGPWLPLTQLDQGHSYPVGDDSEFDYNRGEAMLKYFDIFLKPDENRAPEVLWITPLDGSVDVALSGKWSVGPYTPFGQTNWEMNSYYYPQAIQIRFLDAVDPASVNRGVLVYSESGTPVKGTWVPGQNDALYTFECDGLVAGSYYTIEITDGVKGYNGVALAEERKVSFKTEGTGSVEIVTDTYVSVNEPDKVFGKAEELRVSNAYTSLMTFATDTIVDAEKIVLTAGGSIEDVMGLAIYALVDYSVDETGLTYNKLIASDAWENKVLLGEVSLVDGNLSVDITPLVAQSALGEYVTLAFVSTDNLVGDTAYIFTNDFESPTIGSALTKDVVKDGETSTITVVNSSGSVTRDSDDSVGRVYSDLWYTATGADKGAKLVNSSTIPLVNGSTQALGIYVNTGNNHMKFFNAFSNKNLTADDVGKTFRVTADVYTTQDVTFSVGVSVVKSAGGYSVYTNHNAETFAIKKETWTPISRLITITEAMVAGQAGILCFTANYVEQVDDGVKETYYTYYDNMMVEECTPMLTLPSHETDSTSAVKLITTNKGVALNKPITVTFKEPMDIASFRDGMLVTNQRTGVVVKGEWVPVGTELVSFSFITNGLAAGTTYTVSTTETVLTLAGEACERKVIKTVVTEGNYALRPIATSYVSTSAPNRHFGLNTDPVMTDDKMGVVTFSAKSLANASASSLYLTVNTEKNTTLNVYLLPDFTPDETLCYNSIAQLISPSALLGSYSVKNGAVAIDLADLTKMELGDNVTLVFTAGYLYFNGFEVPAVSTATKQLPGTEARHPENEPFSDTYIWAVTGASTDGWIMPATEEGSQFFRTRAYAGQTNKFYNVLTDSLLTADDVGRTYNVSFNIRAALRSPETYTGNVTTLTVTTGFMNRIAATYNGGNYTPSNWRDSQSKRPSVTLTLGNTEWTEVTFRVTVSELMVGLQAGFLTCSIPKLADPNDSSKSININVDYDDILVKEAINYTVKLPYDNFILVTENSGSVDVTPEDNPVCDEPCGHSLHKPIIVSFSEEMDLSTFKKGMVVANTTTGNRVAGTWTATDNTGKNFAFTTKGLEAGSVYTIATTETVKTAKGDPCPNKVILTVTTEGDYALRPVVTSYVSKTEPAKHFGLSVDPVLDTDKLGIVTFSAATLKSMEEGTLYLPFNVARKTFLYVYAIPDYLPGETLCYNEVSSRLTDFNLIYMGEQTNGTIAIDLASLADREMGANVTFIIKAGYTFANDFETPSLDNVTSGYALTKDVVNTDGEAKTATILSYGSMSFADGTKVTGVKAISSAVGSVTNLKLNEDDYAMYWWSHNGAAQEAIIVQGADKDNQTQVLCHKVSCGANGAKFYNAFRPGIVLTDGDAGRTFIISCDIWTPQAITIYTHPIAHRGAVSGLSGTNYSVKYTTASVANQWNHVEHTITLTAKDVANKAATLGFQTAYSQVNYSTEIQYFDNLLVEEVISEIPIPADSFILVTENREVAELSEADNPVKDEVYVSVQIFAAQVALGTDITVNYYVTLDEAHVGAKMKFTVDGTETMVNAVQKNGEYVYAYTGIAPHGLGVNIKAELIFDGEVIASKDEYSVAQNLKNLLAKSAAELGISEAKHEAMRTLIADLLTYGAAAQVYKNYNVESLVNEGIEGATVFKALDKTWNKMPSGTTDSTIEFLGAGLYFDYANKLYFRFEAANITQENFKVRIGTKEYTLADFGRVGEDYILYTDNISATDLDTLYTVELIKNGKTIQSLEYGVFAYVYDTQNSDNQVMADLAKALCNYGLAADAYAKAN